MTRILIVDDEILIRVGLRSAVDWQTHGFEIAGEASNGKEALAKLMEGNVDILLTDIKMPEMDGIELLEEIKKRKLQVKSIVLSCHDDYEYVREALKLGAHDYLLKLSLNPEKLLHMLAELRNELETSQRTQAPARDERMQENWLKLLYQFSEPVWEEQKALGTRVREEGIAVFALRIDSYSDLHRQGRFADKALLNNTVNSIINNVINDYACGDSFALEEGRFAAVINHKGGDRSILGQMAGNLQQAVKRYMQITLSLGISEGHENPAMLNPAFSQAYKALGRKFFLGKETVCFYADIPKPEITDKRMLFTTEMEESLQLAIELNQAQEAGEILAAFLDRIQSGGNYTQEAIHRALDDIFFLLSKELKIFDKNLEEVPFLDGNMPQHTAREMEYFEDLRVWLPSLAESFFGAVSPLKTSMQREEIRKALELIVSRYHENLTVTRVAQHVSMSENYLSHLFKKEVGEAFTEYLTKYRIERAKEMLRNSGARVNEIAEKVGYENIYYFSNVFKKYTGVSPIEYRKRIKV